MAHKTIPGYLISEEFFKGRKRIVYRAIREEDKKPVIIKTLSKENPSDSEVANLKREYEIIKNLDHECFIKAFDFVSDRKRPAIVLEDIGGKSLRFFIDNGEVDFTTQLEIAIKLADSLAYLNQNQIIHKDINPKNIVVNLETKEFRVIDFSISGCISN